MEEERNEEDEDEYYGQDYDNEYWLCVNLSIEFNK